MSPSMVDGQFGPDIILSNSREATHQLHEPTWHMPSSDGNKSLYLIFMDMMVFLTSWTAFRAGRTAAS
jgi:hypothetical protein